ncbi:MAG: hypothetical protein KAF24_00240, partial [Nitrosopumilaceae archaeon]|nr:hypothetical protein [Nitrosopumilaceae archaeon]
TKTTPTKTKLTKTKLTKTKLTKTKLTKTKISEDVQMSNLNYQKLIQDAKIILESNMSDGILQNELWQRLHIDDKEGSKLIVQLEKNNIATKEKIIQSGKITYKLSIKRKFINTLPIENSPCLICPVEQQCSLDGDINPKTCKLIEEWVIKDIN